MTMIDQIAPSGSVTDITGKTLQLVLNFADSGSSVAADHSASELPQLALVLGAIPLLSAPLSATFDNQWSGVPDASGKTARDRASDQFRAIIQHADGGAANIEIALPSNGTLHAFGSGGGPLYVSHQLSGCSVSFRHGIVLGISVTLKATFGLESLIEVPFQTWPDITPVVKVKPYDVHLDVDAPVPLDLQVLVDTLAAQFVAANLDGVLSSTGPGGDAGPLKDGLQKLTAFGAPAGINRASAVTDSGEHSLTLRLFHPVDPAPTLSNRDGGPSLFHPVLQADKAEVRQGEQLTLIGNAFPPNRMTQLLVGWDDTVTGNIVRSEIEMSVANAPAQRITIPRQLRDNQNTFRPTGLPAATSVRLRVRDCDALTCTAFSNAIEMRTDSGASVQLDIETGGIGVGLPNAAIVDSNGNFTATVTIPSTTSPGRHTILATVGNANASTSVVVQPSVGPRQPQLHRIDPGSGAIVSTGITVGENVTVRGDEFQPGPVQLHLDTSQGRALGSAIADNGGGFRLTFNWPHDQIGQHNIFAVQNEGGITVQASTPLFVQDIPH